MRTGERRPPQRGFSYLLLLFAVAIGGAGLAALGERWLTLAQRERETELLWRGLQIRDALLRYSAALPQAPGRLPDTLEQLLEDRRQPTPRHWLRQVYADPLTGAADWVLLRDAAGGIRGVASRARRIALRRYGLPEGVTLADPATATPAVGDWQFLAVAAPASAATTATTATTTNRRSGP